MRKRVWSDGVLRDSLDGKGFERRRVVKCAEERGGEAASLSIASRCSSCPRMDHRNKFNESQSKGSALVRSDRSGPPLQPRNSASSRGFSSFQPVSVVSGG